MLVQEYITLTLPNGQQSSKEYEVPVLFDKASEPSGKTPEHERDDQPECSTAVVGEKSGEEAGQWVEIVEDWPCHDLVEKTSTIVSPFTHIIGSAVDVSGDIKTESLVAPV